MSPICCLTLKASSSAFSAPYNRLGAAHATIREWCEANNRRLSGPSWEIYGHWQQEWDRDASLIRTDVYYLLEDK